MISDDSGKSVKLRASPPPVERPRAEVETQPRIDVHLRGEARPIPPGRLGELRELGASISEAHRQLGEIAELRRAQGARETALCARLTDLRTQFDRVERLAALDAGVTEPRTLLIEAGVYMVQSDGED